MSDSYKDLVIRYNRGSLSSKEELRKRKALYINTNLLGISNEVIVYGYTENMSDLINYISNEVVSIKSTKTYTNSIILDAFSSATIEGARTTVEEVRKNFSNPQTKSDKMVINTIKTHHFVYNNKITSSNIRTIWESLTQEFRRKYYIS